MGQCDQVGRHPGGVITCPTFHKPVRQVTPLATPARRTIKPTEEHLIEEIAGILWRKRRLRLAEAAAHRRGVEGTLASYRETVKVALVHLDTTGQSERVVDTLGATAEDTQ